MSIKRKDCQICGQFFSSDEVRRKHQRENHTPVKKGRPCIGLAPKTKEERNASRAAFKKKKRADTKKIYCAEWEYQNVVHAQRTPAKKICKNFVVKSSSATSSTVATPKRTYDSSSL